MNLLREKWMAAQMTRYKSKLFFKHINKPIDNFRFKMYIDGEEQTFHIRHFGYIESVQTGKQWSLLDFLDEHFTQKRPTIVNNLVKSLNLRKPDGGNLCQNQN